MSEDPYSVVPRTPKQIVKDKLNNVLTGIILKSQLIQARSADGRLATDLHELEQLATQAITLVRQLD